MSELAEIAAAAGIAIVDELPSDGGDADKLQGSDSTCSGSENSSDGSSAAVASQLSSSDHSRGIREVQELEAMFIERYSDSDPEYVKNVENSGDVSKPPTVTNFSHRRQRDDSRHWNRDRDGRGYPRDRDGRGYPRDRDGRAYPRDRSWDRDRRDGRGHHHNDRDRYNRGRGRGGGHYPREHGDYHQRNNDPYGHRAIRRVDGFHHSNR